jgi:hypothetical protein
MLILGGGILSLEMGTVYSALGARALLVRSSWAANGAPSAGAALALSCLPVSVHIAGEYLYATHSQFRCTSHTNDSDLACSAVDDLPCANRLGRCA